MYPLSAFSKMKDLNTQLTSNVKKIVAENEVYAKAMKAIMSLHVEHPACCWEWHYYY